MDDEIELDYEYHENPEDGNESESDGFSSLECVDEVDGDVLENDNSIRQKHIPIPGTRKERNARLRQKKRENDVGQRRVRKPLQTAEDTLKKPTNFPVHSSAKFDDVNDADKPSVSTFKRHNHCASPKFKLLARNWRHSRQHFSPSSSPNRPRSSKVTATEAPNSSYLRPLDARSASPRVPTERLPSLLDLQLSPPALHFTTSSQHSGARRRLLNSTKPRQKRPLSSREKNRVLYDVAVEAHRIRRPCELSSRIATDAVAYIQYIPEDRQLECKLIECSKLDSAAGSSSTSPDVRENTIINSKMEHGISKPLPVPTKVSTMQHVRPPASLAHIEALPSCTASISIKSSRTPLLKPPKKELFVSSAMTSSINEAAVGSVDQKRTHPLITGPEVNNVNKCISSEPFVSRFESGSNPNLQSQKLRALPKAVCVPSTSALSASSNHALTKKICENYRNSKVLKGSDRAKSSTDVLANNPNQQRTQQRKYPFKPMPCLCY